MAGNKRFFLVGSPAEPLYIAKQGIHTGIGGSVGDKLIFAFDFGPWLSKLNATFGTNKTISSVGGAISTLNGTAPTFGVSPSVSGTIVQFRLDGGNTTWNNGGGGAVSVGNITLTLTMSDSSTQPFTVTASILNPANVLG